ncbi:MAG: phosphoribosylformylglycinamidine synthase, partial [Clostridia bacterium]|nr:phosphoribosylformylglycinamidine synthase [Clostridia bacterium]
MEKKKGLSPEADVLLGEAREILGIKGLRALRILNRYDVENVTPKVFESSKRTVFSEPQVDVLYEDEIEYDTPFVFAAEYLPGQFDQRADSASQCIGLMSKGERPDVRSARVYMLYGDLSESDVAAVKKHVINPVDSREASLEPVKTLKTEYGTPGDIPRLDGFRSLEGEGLDGFIKKYGLAMDRDDLAFCRDYFISEKRDPTLTEIRMIDT